MCQLTDFFLQSDYIDVDGTPKQKQYLLQYVESDNDGIKKQAYRCDIRYSFLHFSHKIIDVYGVFCVLLAMVWDSN